MYSPGGSTPLSAVDHAPAANGSQRPTTTLQQYQIVDQSVTTKQPLTVSAPSFARRHTELTVPAVGERGHRAAIERRIREAHPAKKWYPDRPEAAVTMISGCARAFRATLAVD